MSELAREEARVAREADYRSRSDEWIPYAQRYLERLCFAEWEAHRASKARGRYCPSAYVDALIVFIGRNDEAGFKALKLSQGYRSALGV